MIEIWKFYKTEKYYHVVEFEQTVTLHNMTPKFNLDNFYIYNYYDYDRHDIETYMWRGSTEILGIKLPNGFEL